MSLTVPRFRCSVKPAVLAGLTARLVLESVCLTSSPVACLSASCWRVSVSLTPLKLRTATDPVNNGGNKQNKPPGQRWISYPRCRVTAAASLQRSLRLTGLALLLALHLLVQGTLLAFSRLLGAPLLVSRRPRSLAASL